MGVGWKFPTCQTPLPIGQVALVDMGFFSCTVYSSLGPSSASTPLSVLCCRQPLQPIHHYQPMQLMPVVAHLSPSHFLPSSSKFINRCRAASHKLARLIGHPRHLAAFASLLALWLQLPIQTYGESLYFMSLSTLTDGAPLWAMALLFEAWISQIPRSLTPHLPWSAMC